MDSMTMILGKHEENKKNEQEASERHIILSNSANFNNSLTGVL